MKVFINPGHDTKYDSGAVNPSSGLRECDVAASIGGMLAKAIQNQLVTSLPVIDRGVKEMPGLIVLKHTDMPAVLVETAFIDNDADAELLESRADDFARAIARGITDYECQYAV